LLLSLPISLLDILLLSNSVNHYYLPIFLFLYNLNCMLLFFYIYTISITIFKSKLTFLIFSTLITLIIIFMNIFYSSIPNQQLVLRNIYNNGSIIIEFLYKLLDPLFLMNVYAIYLYIKNSRN
jgi:hypothetical protein